MNKKLQDKLVKLITEKQNAKSKLNAGQAREFIALYAKAVKSLSADEKLELIKYLSR